jgi:FSR family fosmidomycin resistance protein-like MFS transporter
MKATQFSSTAFSKDAFTEILPSAPPAATAKNEHSAFQRGRVYLIAAGHFVNDAYTGFLSPLLPLLMERLQFPLSRAGILASVLSASTSLSQPIFGLINDRLNRRFFVFLGPLLSGIFICSLGYAPSYEVLIPLLLLCGLGSATFHPSAATMVSRLSGSRKEWGMSLFVTSGNIGHAMSPLFVVPVVTYLGFQALPILIFPVLVFAFTLFQKLPHPATLPLHPSPTAQQRGSPNQRVLLSLHLVISILRSVMITAFSTFIPVYMHLRGHSLFSAGATATIFQSIGAAGSLLSGHFAARVDRRRIIMLSLIAASPLLAGFIFFSGAPALFALAASGILLYFSFPLNIVMAQELYPHRASMVSALMIGVSWGLAGLLMTPLGFIAEKIGLQNALLALVACGFVAAFIASFLPKEQK